MLEGFAKGLRLVTLVVDVQAIAGSEFKLLTYGTRLETGRNCKIWGLIFLTQILTRSLLVCAVAVK